MPDDFDGQSAALAISTTVQLTRDTAEKLKPPAERAPLFRTLDDGSVVDRNGQVIRGKVPPLELKGK